MKDYKPRCSNQWVKQQFMNAANSLAKEKLRISRDARSAIIEEVKHYAQYLGVTAFKITDQVKKRKTVTAETVALAAQYFKGYARGAKENLQA